MTPVTFVYIWQIGLEAISHQTRQNLPIFSPAIKRRKVLRQINKMLMIENSKTEYDSSNIYFIGFIEGKAYRPVQERMGILHCLAAILQIMVKKL